MDKRDVPLRLAIASPIVFTGLQLEEYERRLLSNDEATERDASELFSRFPQFLLHGRGAEVRREVSLYDGRGHPVGRVDFFRRSFGRRYWDVVELKGPRDTLVVGKDHPHIGHRVTTAVAQAEDYRDQLAKDAATRTRLLERGILV